jgi:hypothetical protein
MAMSLLVCGLATGCGEDEQQPSTGLEPRVQGLLASDSAVGASIDVTVGQTVYVAGQNFLPETQGRTELMFEGYFQRDDGVLEQASFTVAPVFDGELIQTKQFGDTSLEPGTNVLRLSRFGPFEVPFSAEGNQTGTFKGTLVARNVLTDGNGVEVSAAESEPATVSIRVQPSIIIRTLEPFTGFEADGETPVMANCGAPALRALHNLPYVLEVEAVGFEPDFFNYEFRSINGTEELVELHRPAVGKTDRVGDPKSGQPLVFNAVAEDQSFYFATIRVQASIKGSTTGDYVETALPISVHRPVEFHLESATAQPAQYYEPEPVSGCIPGAMNSVVTYVESTSQSKQNAVSVSLSKSWNQSNSTSQSENWTEGFVETESVAKSKSESWSHSEAETSQEAYGVSYNHSDSQSADFSSTDGESWGWSFNEGTSNEEMNSQMGEVYGEVSTSATVEVSAEGSVPGFAKVGGKVGTTVGATVGGKTGQTVGQTAGSSTNKGSSMDSNHSESSSFGSTTTDSAGESMSTSYAVSSQEQVGTQDTETVASSESKVYNFGGAVGTTDVVSVGNQETWQETWTNTTTNTQLFSYSGKIPQGRHGVWYRQTVRYVRDAQLYSYNLCGVREVMGSMRFNTWAWSPALAVGQCEGANIPVSNLPPAQCLVPPCN